MKKKRRAPESTNSSAAASLGLQPEVSAANKTGAEASPLRIGVDYYLEGSNMVFTADFLRRRGYCCESGCRHCPYGFGPEGLKKRLAEQESRSK